jgi:hypothetical protein
MCRFGLRPWVLGNGVVLSGFGFGVVVSGSGSGWVVEAASIAA